MTTAQNNECFRDGCPFCDIARAHDQAATVVWEGDDCLALFPLDPATVGHTLIIPRCHVEDLWKADDSTAESLMRAVKVVGNAISEALRPDGMNLITSAGAEAEQTVFHLHIHLVPRWKNDRMDKIWPDNGIEDGKALQSAADKIRALLS